MVEFDKYCYAEGYGYSVKISDALILIFVNAYVVRCRVSRLGMRKKVDSLPTLVFNFKCKGFNSDKAFVVQAITFAFFF